MTALPQDENSLWLVAFDNTPAPKHNDADSDLPIPQTSVARKSDTSIANVPKSFSHYSL